MSYLKTFSMHFYRKYFVKYHVHIEIFLQLFEEKRPLLRQDKIISSYAKYDWISLKNSVSYCSSTVKSSVLGIRKVQ